MITGHGAAAARRPKPRSLRLAVALLTATALAAACTDAPTQDGPTIEVDAPAALADQPVTIRITGLAPGERVTVAGEAIDYLDEPWRSQATFVAGAGGEIDLTQDAPTGGSYEGVDGMGLFWSMQADDPQKGFFFPPLPEIAHAYQVRITATGADGESDEAVLRREWLADGVTHRALDLAADGVAGDIYEPAGANRPGVLLIGGSGGGAGPRYEAALLASHGYPALAVSYFAAPGLPAELKDIPVEYFAAAARLLPRPVHVIGLSRGSEAAQLLAALYPDLVASVVLYVPSDRVYPSFPDVNGNAWTHGGSPQLEIPYDRLEDPVLAIAGEQDLLWPSATAALSIERQTGGEALLYENAGHAMAGPPYMPTATSALHPITGRPMNLGGTRAGDAAAAAASWQALLAFLD